MKVIRKVPFYMQLPVSILFLLIIMLFAIWYGAADTTLKDVFEAIFQQKGSQYRSVLLELRFPRVIAAFFVGSALAVAGAVMQGVTRNPLADPGLLGVTAGANAALAGTLVFAPAASYYVIIVSCFIGAGIGMIFVYGISATVKGGLSPMKLVLAGAAVTGFLQAIADGVGILFNISKDVSMWTSGGLIGTTWQALIGVVPFIIIGLILAMIMSRQLTILSLNEDVAIGLGQNIALVKWILMFVVVLLAGASVALVGNLAFVGLMIPHMVRAFVGTDYRYVIPMCMSFGGSFMVLADFTGRIMNAPFETPVVSIVSVIGLPFFLILVRKGGKAFVA